MFTHNRHHLASLQFAYGWDMGNALATPTRTHTAHFFLNLSLSLCELFIAKSFGHFCSDRLS